jgi:hypothetical protein
MIKFADIFRDFLQVGVVNCRQQRSICSGASISTFPAVRWFPADKKESPEVYEGPYTSKELGKWANDKLPNHVTIIEDKHALKKWLDSATGPPVMLFTDKSSTPPMWKALSAEFNNRASLVRPVCVVSLIKWLLLMHGDRSSLRQAWRFQDAAAAGVRRKNTRGRSFGSTPRHRQDCGEV